MSFSARSRLLVVVLVASTLSCAGPSDDMAAPDPSDQLTASNPTPSSVGLAWTAATDDTTSAELLEYRAYFSTADNLQTVSSVLANGTPAGEWLANLTQLSVERLALDTTYFFNVLVRDEAGNMAVYGGASATTLGGTWQDVEPLEDYSGGTVAYPTLTVRPEGDVVATWLQFPSRRVHFAALATDAETFGEATPWSAAGVETPSLAFGFDGFLMGASLRSNGDDTSDVLFRSLAEGPETTFDTVATGLVTAFTQRTLACVGENGDVMVVWQDGTSATTSSLRARFRADTTWGATSLVSGSEGLFIYDMRVVCSPEGNHMVLYGVDDGSSRIWHARVYDNTRKDWEADAVPLADSGDPWALETARTLDGRVVVAWAEVNDAEPGAFLRARTYDGSSWSPRVDTIAEDEFYGVHSLQLAAAGNDVHAVWRKDDRLRTRRLEAGSSTWSLDVPFGPAPDMQEFCLAGDPLGGVLLAWTTSQAVDARFYSPRSESWGPVEPVHAGGESIGYASLGCILDPQRRATVVWTMGPPQGGDFSAFAATYR